MPDNFNTIEGTEVLNLNDDIQGSHAVTVDDIKEYSNIGVPGELVFEAYIRQSGTDDPQSQTSGSLVIGKTYVINGYISGDDFTNVGASSNTDSVRFIATGTTPAVWTNLSNLDYNNGAPTVSYVLKDTLGCTGFTWVGTGTYGMFFPSNLVELKTFVEIGTLLYPNVEGTAASWGYNNTESLNLYTSRDGSARDEVIQSYIKVVVLP